MARVSDASPDIESIRRAGDTTSKAALGTCAGEAEHSLSKLTPQTRTVMQSCWSHDRVAGEKSIQEMVKGAATGPKFLAIQGALELP